MKKIGVLGGTFDPVHMGHTGLAEDALRLMGLDEVILMPAKLSPFKLNKNVTPAEDRLAMVKLVAEKIEGITVSSYEMDAEGISYTYLTMRAVRKMYGADSRLYFITGTDAFLSIERWKEAEELLFNYSYIVGTRPGYREDELTECIDRIRRVYNTEVRNIDNVQLDISSTEIRNIILSGKSAKGLIMPEVEEYIKMKGLYNGVRKA